MWLCHEKSDGHRPPLQMEDGKVLLGVEFVDHDVAVGFAGLEDGVGEVGLIGGVGEELGFEAEGGAVGVCFATFTFGFSIEEISAVELNAGLVGVDFHDATGFGVAEAGRRGGLLLVFRRLG